MPLLFSKYAVSFVSLAGLDRVASSKPPTSSATSIADSATRAPLAAIMASVVLTRLGDRLNTPGPVWARPALRRAAAGRAADRRAAGPGAAPDMGSADLQVCR